ncbi:MAG: hypothetical protein K8F91_10645, partial [Candidatus Obscuribacterales bacterium]|nr:hypothetical protein [Candidatus Obscuribacterales bacterium]
MVETGAHNLDERLEEARGLLADGRLDNCLDTLKQLWLAEPSNGEIISLLAELMKQADEIAISDALTNLAGKFSDNGESASKISPPELADCAQESFEAAYRLIDARQFELAAMLLSNCTKAAPDDPTVNYELGFSLMSLSR